MRHGTRLENTIITALGRGLIDIRSAQQTTTQYRHNCRGVSPQKGD
jgi:hypothetical protein